ncbi:MAG: acyl-CoA dehydrogenase family protein [Pirellulaceae bacterium]
MYRLNTDQQAVVDKATSIADAVIATHAADVDEQGRFPAESMQALADAGFYGLLVPEELGGMQQSLRVLAAVVEQIACRCASTAMVYMMHCSGVSCYLADSEKFADVLRDCVAGKHLSTLAFSEKGSRSQFWAPVSKSVAKDDNTVLLSAEKSWVTSAGFADGIVSSAGSLDGTGASLYLVCKDDSGLTISGGWNSLGMRGNQSNPMTYENIELDLATRLIGSEGKGSDMMLGAALPTFLACQAGIGIGIAQSAFLAAQKHVTAAQFQHTGTRLMDLPNIRANLAQMKLETDKARAYLSITLDKMENSDPDAMLHVLAIKASSGETAVAVCDLAMRTCGGAAFSKHLGIERAFRDSRAAIVMAPTTDHLREFVGRLLVGLPLFG